MNKLDGHNHAPRCCCDDNPELGGSGPCPACPDHGELTPGVDVEVKSYPVRVPLDSPSVVDDIFRDSPQDTTRAAGQWLRYEGNPSRTDHRAAGGPWHPIAICTRVYCGATPDDGEWPAP